MMRWQNRVIGLEYHKGRDIHDHPWQWRTHPVEQQQALWGVLEEIGKAGALRVYRGDGSLFAKLKDELIAIDGHLRKGQDPDETWPCLMLNVTDKESCTLLAVYDPMAAMAGADSEVLTELLEQVRTEDAAIQKLLDQVAAEAGVVLGPEPPEDAGPMTDRAEELQEKWQVKQGDVWEAGGHFVICGDCREAETWEALLSAAGVGRVNGVFTSPPYAEQRKKQYGGVPVGNYVEWWEAVQENVRANLADDGSFFVNIKPHCEKGERVLYVFDLVLAMKRRWGWRFVDELCWKDVAVPGKWPNRFKDGFEPVYHFGQTHQVKFCAGNVSWYGETFKADGKTHFDGAGAIRGERKVMGMVKPSNVIETTTSEGVHPAAFPVALPDFFIRAYSDKGDAWLDPFLGSGTTVVAAHQNERRGLGIEMLEKYVAVTLERLASMGLEPCLLG